MTRVDDTVVTIAHLSERIPRQTLADAELLRTYVEGSLREGAVLALEDEIVNGDGTGEHLLGIDDTPNIQQQAWTTNVLITARKAVTKLEGVRIPPGRSSWRRTTGKASSCSPTPPATSSWVTRCP